VTKVKLFTHEGYNPDNKLEDKINAWLTEHQTAKIRSISSSCSTCADMHNGPALVTMITILYEDSKQN